jgi:hypothetical protein
MIDIYLTTDGKEAIEYRIDELEKVKDSCEKAYEWNQAVIEQNVYKEILYSATILPVYSNWEDVELYPPDNESQNVKTLKLKNGVIIQPKQ